MRNVSLVRGHTGLSFIWVLGCWTIWIITGFPISGFGTFAVVGDDVIGTTSGIFTTKRDAHHNQPINVARTLLTFIWVKSSIPVFKSSIQLFEISHKFGFGCVF